MEIKKENIQKFDFNRLENLKDPEIPLSTERKINFTLDVPLISPKIKYNDKEECVMSKEKLFSGAPVKFYRCPLCSYTPEGERVCEYCFLHCHSGHGNINDLEPLFYTLNDNFCSCARNNHNLSHFQKKYFKKSISENCFFINIHQILRLNTYIKYEEQTFCLGCYNYCLKNSKNKDKFVIVDGILENCYCKSCMHLPKSKPIEVLYDIITDENNTCDLSGALYNLITNPEMNKMIILPLIILFSTLSNVDFPKTRIINNIIKSNEINLKVLKALIKRFNIDDVMIIDKLSDIIISDVISQTDNKTYQNANAILYSPFLKFFNLLEIKDNSSDILSIKYYALFFFRKLFILPVSGIKNNYSITNKVKIITAFHRLYCRMTKEEFFDNLLPYDCDDDLFDKIINHLTTKTILFPNEETYLYIKENLKWYLLIVSIEYSTNEERDKYISTIINKIIFILDNIKENKIFEKDENKTYIEEISKYIQKIVIAIILSVNDKVFKDYIIDRDKGIPLDKEKEKKNIKFFFSKNGVLKNEFPKIIKMLLFFSSTKHAQINSKIYKLLLRTEDHYITLLEYFTKNKQQISTKLYTLFTHVYEEKQNNLNELSNLIKTLKDAKIQYYRHCDFMAFSESFNNNLDEILIEVEKYRNYIDELDNSSLFQFNTKTLQQLHLIKIGFFNDLLSIYDFYKKAFHLDKKMHNDGKKDYKDVQDKIFNISVAFANNAFIFPIFLTKKFLKIIVKYDKVHKKYFLGTGEIIFYCKLLKEIAPLKLNNDYSYLIEVALNVIFDDDFEKMVLLFKLLKYIIKLNCKDTSKKISHLICYYLESNKYQKYFPKYSEDEEYTEETVETFKPLETNQITLLLRILKIINLLDDYYYCIFIKKFPIDSIKQMIIGYRKELQNCTEQKTIIFYEKILRTCSYTYAKYYVITPFVVYIDTFKNKEYDKYIESGYPIVFEKEGLHNLVRKPIIKFELSEELDNMVFMDKNISPQISFDFWRLSPEVVTRVNEKIKLETLFEFITEKDNFIDAWNNEQIYTISKETNGIYYKKHTEILNILIENLEMGGIQLRNLKNEPKNLFKHFENVILKPTCYMIYHCLYYCEINSNQKYIIYKILILFLKCYKEFLQLIIDKIMDFAKENRYKKFRGAVSNKDIYLKYNRQYKIRKSNNFFFHENEKKLELLIQDFFVIDEYQQDIKIYLLNTRDCVDIDIDLIGKNPLDTILLLRKFTKYLVKLKKIKFTQINKDNEQIFLYFINSEENKVIQKDSEEVKERKEFLNHMNSFIEIYKELKSDKSQNIFFESIGESSQTGNEILNSIFNDILCKCLNKNENEKIFYNQPYYLRDEYLTNFESFNEIIIQNPSLFQDFLLEEDRKYIENQKIDLKSGLTKDDDVIEEEEEEENVELETEDIYESDDIISHKISNDIIKEIISQLKILYQYVIIDYHKFLGGKEPYSVKCFNNLIEFLRLLCENHNQIYQLLLSKYPIDVIKNEEELNKIYGITLPQLLFQVPPLSNESIDFSNSKNKYVSYLKEHNTNFFDSIINKVTDFLIEMIQGSKSSLILKTSNLYFLFYLIMGDLMMDNDIKTNINYLSEFFRFMICFVEENAIDVKEKNEVINLFNARKLVFYLADCVKMLYQNLPQTPELKEAEKTKSIHQILHEEFLLNTNFFTNNNQYFNISCYICKFLNLAATFGNIKIAKLLNEFEGVKNEEKLDQKALWRRESTIFFSKLLRKVYINQVFTYIQPTEEKEIDSGYSIFEDMIDIRDDGSNEEFEAKHHKEEKSDLTLNTRTTTYIETFRKNSTIANIKIKDSGIRTNENKIAPSMTTIFICHPDVLLLDKEDFIDFENFAPYDSQQGKLIYLLKYIPTLIEKIDYKKTILKKNSKLYEVLYNIDNFKILQISAILVLIINFLLLISVHYDMKTFFVNKMIIERHSNLIFIIQLIHLIFLFLVFYNWFFFKLFFLRTIKKQYSIKRKELLHSFLFDDINLSLLIWNFFWGIIGAFTPTFHFAYSFQLFSIFGCFETMSTVFTSIQMRGKQFMGAGLLILIFSLFFTGIKFYYFCDPTTEECERFSNCYLSMITLGIRAGNGLGLSMKSIHSKGYFTEFLIEWLFFFVIILVMLNIINGIIVDTFQEQREKNNIRNDAKLNRCFICHHERQYIEKNGYNSSIHMYEKHSYRNYFDYLITIQKQNKLDLNSLDFVIWKKMEQEKTDFFPKNL